MSNFRNSLLKACSTGELDYSKWRGVYIEDVNGKLWTSDEWDGSVTPNGVAVLTDDCRFVMALEDANDGNWCEWGGYGIAISDVTSTSNETAARVDYDGEVQTTSILNKLGNNSNSAPAAYYCRNYIFPNGQRGYLGAAGEWSDAVNNGGGVNSVLSMCGGKKMNSSYFTSTQWNAYYVWRCSWDSSSFLNSNRTSPHYVRAFTTLKSETL